MAVLSSMPTPSSSGRWRITSTKSNWRLRVNKCWSMVTLWIKSSPSTWSPIMRVLPLVSPRTIKEPWMVAPAEVPAITPPRASKALNSRCARVFRYESASRQCRPPVNQTPVALRKEATKPGSSACLRSRVCKMVTLSTPRRCSRSFSTEMPEAMLASSLAVGITTMLAPSPPANSMKRAQMSGPTLPPPTMMSAPCAGPTVGVLSCACAEKLKSNTFSSKNRLHCFLKNIPQ